MSAQVRNAPINPDKPSMAAPNGMSIEYGNNRQACDICHRRKVRCNSRDQLACTKCQASNLQCTFLIANERLKRIRPRSRSSRFSYRQNRRLQAKNTPVPIEVAQGVGPQTSPKEPNTSQPSEHVDHSPRHSLVLTEHDIVEEGLARTSLTEFLGRGFHAPAWDTFHEDDPIRIAYVGTPLSNLAYLVSQESPYHGNASLHFSSPSIRPKLPWKPSPDLPLLKWYSTAAQDISLLPEKEVRDQLIEDYFAKINPGFPVIDEAEFRSDYADENHPPALLLLQSVLLAGAHVCNHPKVAKSRSLVKVALFRRAKALFNLHYENNREHLIQAALLFTWHFEGADDIGANVYYWVGVACRIAFGLGIHRNLSARARSVIPVQDRRIQRRLWWTLFQYDVLASLHHGRPLMIDENDCDQPPLEEQDFIEINGQLNKNIRVDYCVQNIKLCSIISSIMKLFSPGSLRHHGIAQRLDQSWFTALTMLLAAAIQMAREARIASSSGSHILCLQAQSRLENLFSVMNKVSEYWPSTEAIYRLFRDVQAKMRLEIERTLQTEETLETGRQIMPHSQDINHIGFEGPLLGHPIGLSEEDWSSLFGTSTISAFFDDDLNSLNDWLAYSTVSPTAGNDFI
ncbi:hypothetical protein B7463_g7029, partial [Scytalidium lignicola]